MVEHYHFGPGVFRHPPAVRHTFGPGGWGLSERARDIARIGLHAAILRDSIERSRMALLSIVGIYEEQAARKQYDILGDGSV